MPADKVQFRPGPLASALAARADADDNVRASQTAQRDLGRYYYLLSSTLASVELSAGEAALVVDVLNGTIIDLTVAQLLAAEVEDALGDGLAEKWEVDGHALVAKLAGYSLAQRLAICDAVERFWAAGYHVGSTADRLSAVGLVRRG